MIKSIIVEGVNGQVVHLEKVDANVLKLLALMSSSAPATMTPMTMAPEAKILPPVEDKPVETRPVPKNVQVASKRPRKSRKRGSVEVSILDCIGYGLYPTMKGMAKVAIWKIENGREILLWIDEDGETCRHDSGGFKNTMGKLHNVQMF